MQNGHCAKVQYKGSRAWDDPENGKWPLASSSETHTRQSRYQETQVLLLDVSLVTF